MECLRVLYNDDNSGNDRAATIKVGMWKQTLLNSDTAGDRGDDITRDMYGRWMGIGS